MDDMEPHPENQALRILIFDLDNSLDIANYRAVAS